jgi:hypothetical protein
MKDLSRFFALGAVSLCSLTLRLCLSSHSYSGTTMIMDHGCNIVDVKVVYVSKEWRSRPCMETLRHRGIGWR